MVVEPSWIVSLTALAEKRGTWPVRLMLVGGENMSEKSRRYVEETWRTDLFLTYGQTESFGSAGSECVRKNGYHLQELKFWFEIPEADADGNGELVFATRASVDVAVRAALQERFPDLARNIAMGLCEFKVVAVPPGTLRTGRKLRAVVDLRKVLFGAETAVPSAMPA